MDTLLMEVNQGCPRGFAFTIMQRICDPVSGEYSEVPVNLNEYNVSFQVKLSPFAGVAPIINKLITQTSDEVNVGRITNGINGEFKVQLTGDDLRCLVPQDYNLLLYLEKDGIYTNLGADGKAYAIFRVCHQ